MTVSLLGICIGSLLAGVSICASPRDEIPAWLKQAADIKLPVYDKDVEAVVLVDDGRKIIDADGRVSETFNFAVRILRHEGRERAVAHVGYIPDIGKVKELGAW